MRRKSPPKPPRFRKTTASLRCKDCSEQLRALLNLSERRSESGLQLADQKLLVTPAAQPPVGQESCQDQQGAHDQKETVRVLSQRNATYVHAEQTRHQVNRQGQHSY